MRAARQERGEIWVPPPAGESSIHPPRGVGRLGSSRSLILGDPLSLPPAAVDPVICKLPRGFPSPASQRSLLSVLLWGRPKSRTRGADFPGGGHSPASPTPCGVIKAPALSPYVGGGGPKGCPLPVAPPFSCPPSSSPPAAPQGRGIARAPRLGSGGSPKAPSSCSGGCRASEPPRSPPCTWLAAPLCWGGDVELWLCAAATVFCRL